MTQLAEVGFKIWETSVTMVSRINIQFIYIFDSIDKIDSGHYR